MERSADSSTNRDWRFGRKTLIVAAILTTAMFGWQAYHLYDSYQAVAQRDSGECPTRAVEAVYSAGERLDYLTEEIEHSLFFWGPDVASSPIPELAARYDETEAELDAALEQATRLSKGKVLAAVEQLDEAHEPLHEHVEEVLGLIESGEVGRASAEIAGSQFLGLRADYAAALNSMWTASREHLVVQLQKERRAEVLSVGIALVLFAAAVGAWGVFLGRIRKGQARLREEEVQRKRAEEELLQAQKMDALGSMAGGIAHDFNNLVTAIWGSATSARAHLDADNPAVPSIERIEDASEQANGVIRSLLTFSRRAESVKAPVEIGTLIDATVRILSPMLRASIEIESDRPSDPVLWVTGDVTQIQQALMNLALNADEAMPDGGKILIRAWACSDGPTGDDRVLIEVADTGEGMSEATASRVFEPFFTTRAPGQGTGLGLSIVHGVVTDHGGHIRVETEPGEGSSFIINLPAIDPPLHQEEVLAVSDLAVNRTGDLIVMVEDHQHVREIIAESLEEAGFAVAQTTCGEEFLTTIKELGSDVALLIADVDIPPPSGVDCIRVLREGGSTVPAIVITGTPAPGLEEELEGLAVVLRKPFTMAELVGLADSLAEPAPV